MMNNNQFRRLRELLNLNYSVSYELHLRNCTRTNVIQGQIAVELITRKVRKIVNSRLTESLNVFSVSNT